MLDKVSAGDAGVGIKDTISFLAFGDVVGRTGRAALKQVLPELRALYQPNLVIMNGENLAHGIGVSRRTIEEMVGAGVDVITSGNHIWDKKEVYQIFSAHDLPVMRPLNYPVGVPGPGYLIVERGVDKWLVINVMGRVFMDANLDDPFRAIDRLLQELQSVHKFSAIIVDIHAEATSEKIALGHYLDGRVSCVFGTHTHVQTADEKILARGTGFLSDLGMSGARDSVIGVTKDVVIKKFLDQLPTRFVVAEGTADVSGLYCEIDPRTMRAVKVERVQRIVEL